MKPQYMIKDWAGNLPFGEVRFSDFEDAWSYIYSWAEQRYGIPQSEDHERQFDSILGEYRVEEA